MLCRRVIDVLDGRQHDVAGESPGENELLPVSYGEDIKRFAKDSEDSLRNHRIMREVQMQEMEKVFAKYEGVMKQNMAEMRQKAEEIEMQRRVLSPKLFQFTQYVVEDSTSA